MEEHFVYMQDLRFLWCWCCVIDCYQNFEANCCLHLQSRIVNWGWKEVLCVWVERWGDKDPNWTNRGNGNSVKRVIFRGQSGATPPQKCPLKTKGKQPNKHRGGDLPTRKQLNALLPQRSVRSNWEWLGCKGGTSNEIINPNTSNT
jgi:hypothetical protein